MKEDEISSSQLALIVSRACSSTLADSHPLFCVLVGSRTLSSAPVHSDQLTCALSDSHALSAIFVPFQRLLRALSDFRALSSTLLCSCRLSCALSDSRTLSSRTLVRSHWTLLRQEHITPACAILINRNLLHDSFHLNVHILRFPPQTQKLDQPRTS